MTLHERFKDFIKTIETVEDIDALHLNKVQTEAKKADYFAVNRELVIELKSLETDTEQKIEKIIRPLRERPEFPHFFGGWEIDKVLGYFPEEKEIKQKILKLVTTSLTEDYRGANRQIRSTKKSFSLPEAQGLLIILNEQINVLDPEVIRYELLRMSQKKFPNQSFQFPEINCFIIFSESYFSPTNGMMGYPIIHQAIETVAEFRFKYFIDFLIKKWAEYNGHTLMDAGHLESIKNLNLKSVRQYKEDTKIEIKRSEGWRRDYKLNPYFRRYDDVMLLWFYEIIMQENAPNMLKGFPKDSDRSKFWIEVFTHFIEEVNFRGLDFKTFATKSQEIGRKLKEEVDKNNL